MSHEGDGMKLRDLARSSSSPTSFMPALHVFRSRFRNRETSRCSRRSYESVPASSSTMRLLILLQQATVVPILGILRRPHHPGSPVTLPIRTHHGDQNICQRTCHRPAPLLFSLIFGQNQHNVYSEVLIAGDLTKEDILQMRDNGGFFLSNAPASDTGEFAYDGDTVYFAQPSLSQFVPGGSGPGAFDQSIFIYDLNHTPNNTLAFTGRNATNRNTGVVLRYALPDYLGCSSTS